MKNMIELCKTGGGGGSSTNKRKNTLNDEDLLFKTRPLINMFGLIEQCPNLIQLLKDNDMCLKEKKVSIIKGVEDSFKIMNSRTSSKNSADDLSVNSYNLSK